MQYIKQRWQELACKSTLETVQMLMFSVFFAECVIGGSGRLISFGYLSLRILLFLICFFLTLPTVLRAAKDLIRQPVIWIWAVFFVFLAVYAGIGYVNGNALSFIRQDITMFLTLLLLPGILVLFNSHKRVLWAVDLIFAGTAFIAAITLLLHILLAFLPNSAIIALNNGLNHVSLGGLAMFRVDYFRIYLRSQIFLQFGAMIGLYKLVACQSKKMRFWLMLTETVIVYTMILSYTRGFWLGFAISCVVLLVCCYRNILKYLKAIAALLVGLVLLFSLSFVLYGNNSAFIYFADRIGITVKGSAYVPLAMPSTGADKEIQEFIDETNEEAQSVRDLSLQEHKRLIAANPVLGYGLGKNLDGIRDEGRSEYSFIDLYMKLGLFGFLSFALMFCTHAGQAIVLNCKRKKGAAEFLPVYLAAGYIGVLATSYLNPFVTSPMGIVMLFTLILTVRSACMQSKSKVI